MLYMLENIFRASFEEVFQSFSLPLLINFEKCCSRRGQGVHARFDDRYSKGHLNE